MQMTPFSRDEKVFKASKESTEYRNQRYEVCPPCKDLPSSDLQDNRAGGRDLYKALRIRESNAFPAEEDGLLRSQTRLRNVVYHEGIKHLIMLPGDHIASELIVTDMHRRLLHAGGATTVAELRERFWVTKAKGVREKSDRAVYLVRAITGEACDGSYGGATCRPSEWVKTI
ncbi:hypothetical protein MTO96_032623 [Rhipicephalus appendiculatus]